MTKDEILEAALKLSPEDRAEVANMLLDSVGEGGEELDEATMAEIRRRCAEIDAGTAKMLTLEEVQAHFAARFPDFKPPQKP